MDRSALAAFLPHLNQPDLWLIPMQRAIEFADLSTQPRLTMFMSQCAHESMGFTHLQENLNYSAQALLATFPAHFTDRQAADYAHQPTRIGARVYADRLGNGPEASGDGYLYRGRGLIQITGRDNYRACSQALRGDDEFVRQPDALCQRLYAALSAAWFWHTHRLNDLADIDDFREVTRRINGGYNGLADRQQWLVQAQAAFGAA